MVRIKPVDIDGGGILVKHKPLDIEGTVLFKHKPLYIEESSNTKPCDIEGVYCSDTNLLIFFWGEVY